MVLRRFAGSRVSRQWDVSRLGKGAEPPYWLYGFGHEHVPGAIGIGFGIIAIDVWEKRPSRYDAVKAANARNAERGRLSRWVARDDPGAGYGRKGEPMLSSPRLSKADAKATQRMCRSEPGRLLHVACAVATAIEGQRCWTNPLLDSASIRIDLEGEIRQIAAIARSIKDAEEALGAKPSGKLGKNDDVVSIYQSRCDALDDRVDLLLERVQTLRRYWDNLKSLDDEFDRLEWIREKSVDDGRDFTIAVEQERQQLTDAAQRAEDVAGVGEAVLQSLIEDARLIFTVNRNN